MRLAFVVSILLVAPLFVVGQSRLQLGYLGKGDCLDWTFFEPTPRRQMKIGSRSILQTGQCKQRIKINGREIELTSVKTYLPDRNWKVGHGGYELLKGKDTTVRLDYVFTWLCPPKDENCEVYYYRGILDIAHKGIKRRLKVVGTGGS